MPSIAQANRLLLVPSLALGLLASGVFMIACGDGSSAAAPATDTAPARDTAPATDTATVADTGPLPPPDPPALRNPETLFPNVAPGATGVQTAPSLGPAGELLVAWSGTDGNEDLGIWLARFDSELKSLGPVLNISTGAGLKNEPVLCALAGGRHVAVWSADAQNDGGTLQIHTRLLEADGTPLGAGDTEVRTSVDGGHWLADAACAAGGYIVAGVRSDPDDTFGVFAWRHDVEGNSIGEAIAAHDDPAGGQVFPAVGLADDGTAVVAWDDMVKVQEEDVETVQATRLPAAGGHGPRWTLAGGDGEVASGVDLDVDPKSGVAAIAFMIDGARIELFRLRPEDAEPKPWPGWAPAPGAGPAVKLLEREDRLALAWLSRAQSGGELHLRVIDEQGSTLDEHMVQTTSFLPYRVELSSRGGYFAVGYTDRAESGAKPGARVLRFGPE